MFDSIAKDYDSLNHVLSLSIDKIWRRKALKKIVDAGENPRVLDVACGTGDFSIAIAKAIGKGSVIGIDISNEMLEVMRQKVLKNKLESVISVQAGDGEDLIFPDGSFDRVVNAFEHKIKKNLDPCGACLIDGGSHADGQLLRHHKTHKERCQCEKQNNYYAHFCPHWER